MGILKVIEILASSPNSWEEAAANAVTEATKTVRGIKSVYIQEQSATVEDGKIKVWRDYFDLATYMRAAGASN